MNFDQIKNLDDTIKVEYKIVKKKINFFSQNLENFQKYIGLTVGYQQSFQLIHNVTGLYLGYSSNSDKIGEKYQYEVNLFEIPGENTTFKIHPSKVYQRESEGVVFYSEPIYMAEMSSLTEMTYYLYSPKSALKQQSLFDSKYTGMVGEKLKNGMKIDFF